MDYFNKVRVLPLLLALWASDVCAQGTVLSGHIYDSQTRQPLTGVNILDHTGNVVALSGDNGFFNMDLPPAGGRLTFSLIGYKSHRLAVQQSRKDMNIQLEADPVRLDEVRVGLNNRANRQTPGAVALLTADDIRRGNGVSLQTALNTVPGVRMDQSNLSDSRIAIRGNGVRAPWGIRAVKIYVNDIPVTETDGTTRIEALDVSNIGRAEIIKGPASSIYGAGAAGVINFQLQRAPYGERSQEVSGLTGSYGLRRVATAFRSGGDKVNSVVSYGWQEYDGFRSHARDMRRFISGNFQFFPGDRQIVTVLVNRSTQHSRIPGALTAPQVAADPRQASGGNVEKAAGRYQNWTRIGIGQQYRLTDRLSNSTSLFTYFYDIDHPLPFAYIRNYYQSYGGRSRFTYDAGFTGMPTIFIIGGEFNQGLTKGLQYVNDLGTEGPITTNTDYRNTVYTLFFQSETSLGPNTLLTLGLGFNSLRYDVSDYLVPERSGLKHFSPRATPRAALSHTFSEALTVHAGVSTGFTPPTSSEIRNTDGSVNPHLQAEQAVNYEINAKGSLLGSRLSYDLALFRMDMRGELIAQTVQQGITIYNNTGKTDHRGGELALSWEALAPDADTRVNRLRPYVAITYSDFSFVDYRILAADNTVAAIHDGNELTGIAPWVVSAGVDVETRIGIYANCNYLYNDRLPLDDANSTYHPSYHLLNAKAGYTCMIRKRIRAELFAGVDNLLDQHYSSFVSLNAAAFGGGQPPYFNPSPGRNAYGGIQLSYRF